MYHRSDICGSNGDRNVPLFYYACSHTLSINGSFRRLYGCTNIQTFLYLKNYPQDWTFQKCAVSKGVYVIRAGHVVLIALRFGQGHSPLACALLRAVQGDVVIFQKAFGLVAHGPHHH